MTRKRRRTESPSLRALIAVSLLSAFSLSRATPPPLGWLSIISTPPGAQITIDGQTVGAVTNATFALAPGSHVVVISGGPGNLSCRIEKKVEAKQTVEVRCPS